MTERVSWEQCEQVLTMAGYDASLGDLSVKQLATAYLALLDERDRYREALETIRGYGVVCADFETCAHASCRDSYAAWAVADVALAQPGSEGE